MPTVSVSGPQNDRNMPQPIPRNGVEYLRPHPHHHHHSNLPEPPPTTDQDPIVDYHSHALNVPLAPYNSFDNSNCDYLMEEQQPSQLQPQQAPHLRRVLRQSTMPNPEVSHYSSNNNLMVPPGSPKQLISPQYSPYNTDNEDTELQPQTVMPPGAGPGGRFGIRRQSTLPCPPNAGAYHNSASTSPNRMYSSRSPERGDGSAGDLPRMAPFVRQATFPSNLSDPLYQNQLPLQQQKRTKLLPTSPNRMAHFNKSPDGADCGGGGGVGIDMPKRGYPMMRQATLPNPDQHMKLLPTSPPKKQLSPSAQSLKRSPEFVRQNTLPNPPLGMGSAEMSTLNIPQQKFLPISPRQKQSFFFPQSAQSNPRPFLSQQNMPTVNDEHAQTQSPIDSGQPSPKMIKVRSHSNEEYSMTRPIEGRRLLPEIPRNRSPR